ITMRPDSHYFRVENQVVTVPPQERLRLEVRALGPYRSLVRGQIPLGSRPVLRYHEGLDPTHFARTLFIELLERQGLPLLADPLQPSGAPLPPRNRYDEDHLVAKFVSPPLSEFVKVALKASPNLYADALPLLIAAHAGRTTQQEGLTLLRQTLAQLGVDT